VSGHPLSTLPRPRTPGPEMTALARFYVDVSWSGTIEPDGMGPGSPAMSAQGRGVHHRIHGGLWIVGDYLQDQFLPDGTFVLSRQLHWVTGWDADAGGVPGHAERQLRARRRHARPHRRRSTCLRVDRRQPGTPADDVGHRRSPGGGVDQRALRSGRPLEVDRELPDDPCGRVNAAAGSRAWEPVDSRSNA
jgi:hypothetical protein